MATPGAPSTAAGEADALPPTRAGGSRADSRRAHRPEPGRSSEMPPAAAVPASPADPSSPAGGSHGSGDGRHEAHSPHHHPELWPTGPLLDSGDGDSCVESVESLAEVMERIRAHISPAARLEHGDIGAATTATGAGAAPVGAHDDDGFDAELDELEPPTTAAAAAARPMRSQRRRAGALRVPIVIAGRTVAHLSCPGEGVPTSTAAANASPLASQDDLRTRLALAADLLGEIIGRDHALRHRIAELNAVYRVSSALAGLNSLDEMLLSSLRTIIEVMGVKAGSIRLLKDDGTDELILRAYVNLSEAYFDKGPVFAGDSEIDTRCLAGEMIYVENLGDDPRVRFPDLVAAEGLRSFLSSGLIFQDQPVGVIRLYTGEVRHFGQAERRLFQAASQQVATAIVNRRLLESQERARSVQRQVNMASDIQRRMLPQEVPNFPPFDVAAGYLPSLELGGDFYDFVSVGHELGILIGDVVGKGVPAALLMASVRANLRVYAGSFFQVDEIIGRTNRNLVHDTHTHEFATVWYGAIDSRNLQITFCNAGHDPALIFRRDATLPDGFRITPLAEGGMVIGVDPRARYRRASFRLHAEDVLIAYTDGLPDAMNFDAARFGKQRVQRAVLDILRAQPAATARQIKDHVLWEMRRFVGLNTQSDDVTLVVVRVTSGPRTGAAGGNESRGHGGG